MTRTRSSWDNYDCNNQNEAPFTPNGTHLWEGEDRVKLDSVIGGQRAMLQLKKAGLPPSCVGTLIADDWMLTAAPVCCI